MSTNAQSSPDVIGKVFVVCSHGLRQCLVCGELFTRSLAHAHTEVNCYPARLLEPKGGEDVTA